MAERHPFEPGGLLSTTCARADCLQAPSAQVHRVSALPAPADEEERRPSRVRVVELPLVDEANRCTGCRKRPTRETGDCECSRRLTIALAASAPPASPDPGLLSSIEWRGCIVHGRAPDEMGPRGCPECAATTARSTRLYQCPGCWGYGFDEVPPTDGSLECDCGQKLDCIDLRGERNDDTATWNLHHPPAASAPPASPDPGLLREALRQAVRILSGGRKGYVGDHYIREVQVRQDTVDRLRAALAAAPSEVDTGAYSDD